MRVISGIWGGRQLTSPGKGVRPTQDRVRQILFDILTDTVREGHVLDLYAGSGALGLEAISRGAPWAVFVEGNGRTRKVLQQNCRVLGAESCCRILGLPVLRALHLLESEGAQFRWILADPPYGDPELSVLMQRLGAPDCSLFADEGGLVIENRASDPLPEESGRLRSVRRRRIGETSLHFYAHRKGEA